MTTRAQSPHRGASRSITCGTMFSTMWGTGLAGGMGRRGLSRRVSRFSASISLNSRRQRLRMGAIPSRMKKRKNELSSRRRSGLTTRPF
ncbi:hypothetical protein BJX64DRAFT_253815 [Aspergillus heterothallicus]